MEQSTLSSLDYCMYFSVLVTCPKLISRNLFYKVKPRSERMKTLYNGCCSGKWTHWNGERNCATRCRFTSPRLILFHSAYNHYHSIKVKVNVKNFNYQVWIWVLFVFGFITFLTEYWYTGFYKCGFAILALYFTPKYTRLSGFYLRMNERFLD